MNTLTDLKNAMDAARPSEMVGLLKQWRKSDRAIDINGMVEGKRLLDHFQHDIARTFILLDVPELEVCDYHWTPLLDACRHRNFTIACKIVRHPLHTFECYSKKKIIATLTYSDSVACEWITHGWPIDTDVLARKLQHRYEGTHPALERYLKNPLEARIYAIRHSIIYSWFTTMELFIRLRALVDILHGLNDPVRTKTTLTALLIGVHGTGRVKNLRSLLTCPEMRIVDVSTTDFCWIRLKGVEDCSWDTDLLLMADPRVKFTPDVRGWFQHARDIRKPSSYMEDMALSFIAGARTISSSSISALPWTYGLEWVELLRRYATHPVQVRLNVLFEHGNIRSHAAHLLAMVQSFERGEWVFKSEHQQLDCAVFFKMAAGLPTELQHILCLEAFEIEEALIPFDICEMIRQEYAETGHVHHFVYYSWLNRLT